jgi:hypothetical protein
MIYHITLYRHCLIKNFIWEASKRKTQIKKRVQCIICPNIIHQKSLWEKWMIWHNLVSILPLKNFIWETLRKKLIQRKECNMMFSTNYQSERRETLPLKLANLSYRCTQHMRNVEYVRFCEYLFEVNTMLSLQIFICPYDLWNITILMQNIAII